MLDIILYKKHKNKIKDIFNIKKKKKKNKKQIYINLYYIKNEQKISATNKIFFHSNNSITKTKIIRVVSRCRCWNGISSSICDRLFCCRVVVNISQRVLETESRVRVCERTICCGMKRLCSFD